MHNSLEIVTPAVCMDLTVLETAKMELGIASTDTSKDDLLATLIKQASGIVSDYCNRVFGAEEVIETFWVDGPSEFVRSVMLTRSPIIAILDVFADNVLLDPSEYRMGSDGHLHRIDTLGVTNWILTQTIEVHYQAGYVLLDDLPYGVERAALSLIKGMYFSLGSDPSVRSEDIPGVRSVSYQVGTTSGTASLPLDVVALLRPHRRLVFA
jgi:hypothetical protein